MALIVLSLLFCSGFSGLVYEVTWARLLTLVLGNTAVAHSLILAVFMSGLAFGSWFFGRLADREKSTSRLYGLLEITIGAFGLASPYVLQVLSDAYVAMEKVGVSPWAAAGARAGLCAAVLFVPAALMGGTLPSLARFIARGLGRVESGIASLYSSNCIGASVGALLTGFWLIPSFGLGVPIYLAAAIDMTVGLLALTLSRPIAQTGSSPKNVSGRQGSLSLLLYAAVFISGVLALSLEIAWIRLLSIVLGSSAYAFSLMLSAFIAGIALGSYGVRRFALHRMDPYVLFGWSQSGIGLSLAATIPLYCRLPYYLYLAAGMLYRTPQTFLVYELINLLLCFLVMLPPTILMGASLPLAVGFSAEGSTRIGGKTGRIFAFNAAGNTAGAVLGGLVLLPALGLQGLFELCALASLILGALILSTSAIGVVRRARIVGTATAGFLLLIIVVMNPWDARVLAAGEFRGSPNPMPQNYAEYRGRFNLETVLMHRDDPDATIDVIDAPSGMFVKTNGKVDASAGIDRHTEILLGHIPFLFKPDAREALLVGLGSGMTAGSILSHPLERLDVVEISRGMVEASRYFAQYNGHPLDDARAHLHIEDAHSFIEASNRLYDVLISEPSNPWVAGNGNLFSVDFYRYAKAHLRPGGVMAQWFHLYEMDDDTLKLILRTFCSQFEHVMLWEIPPSKKDVLLIGSAAPISADFVGMEAELRRPEIARDLERIGVRRLTTLLSLQVLSDGVARDLAGTGPVNEDRFPVLEYSAPKALFMRSSSDLLLAHDERLARRQRETLWMTRYLQARAHPASRDELAEMATFQSENGGMMAYPMFLEWARRFPNDPGAELALVRMKVARRDEEGALGLLEHLIQSKPNDLDALELAANLALDVYLQDSSYLGDELPSKSLDYWRRVGLLANGNRRTNALRKIAEIYANVGRLDLAERFIGKAATSAAEAPNAASGGADSLWLLGAQMAIDWKNDAMALRCVKEALKINPANEAAQRLLRSRLVPG